MITQDLQFAIRQLRKNPGFTAIAVLTLALGIGANTAIFSLVNALLFRPLPFRDPGRLVWIANPNLEGEGTPGTTRIVNLRDWRQLNHSFEDLGWYVAWLDRMQYKLTLNGESDRVQGVMVSPNFLDVLGARPFLGKNFADEEGVDAVILTDSFWRNRFHGDPAIVGRSITLSDRPWVVMGVLPASFDFSSIFTPGSRAVDFLRVSPRFGDLSGNAMAVVGRLKPGISVARAQLEFDVLNSQLQSAHRERGKIGARLMPLREHISGQFRRPFLALSCAVACVLLIACANLSNLLLARAAARRREIAVRVALGAGRWRLVRQTLTESALLSFCGGAFGLPLAYAATNAMARSHAFSLPLLRTARVDSAALAFTIAAACATGLLFGIVPALQLSLANIQGDLREAGRGAGQGKRRVWIREALVVSEMATACVLLVGAGLLIHSFVGLLRADLGFRPEKVLAWRIRPSRDFATDTERLIFHEELARRVGSLPGVESAGFTDTLPMGLREVVKVRAFGETYRDGETPSALLHAVDKGYFKTLRIPLRSGRTFDLQDAAFQTMHPSETGAVVVVNQKLAQGLWPGKDAVGQLALLDFGDLPLKCKVLGVVGDVRQSPLEPEASREIYLLGVGGELVLRTRGASEAVVSAVRATLRQIDPGMVGSDFKSLSQLTEQLVSPERLVALLASLFSLLAVILASVGIYGVIACSVSQRTQEIGIRLALGSSKAGVLRLVIRDGMKLALIGCGSGLLASLLLTRVLQALLFGVKATDPLTYLASGLLLLTVALLACWLPARGASRVDPLVALRHE